MKTFTYIVSFHKAYPFVPRDWITPVCFEPVDGLDFPHVVMSEHSPSVCDLFASDARFASIAADLPKVGYYTQTIAAEHWAAHHVRDVDYIGITGYRRYILPTPSYNHYGAQALHVQANANNLQVITDDRNLDFAARVLDVYDAILPLAASSGQSVKDQYLSCGQRADIWSAFIEGVARVMPAHADKLAWFDLEHRPHYCGNMGFMPLGAFKDYALSYLEVVRYILRVIPEPFVVLDESSRFRSDRWIGFLSERYFSYFVFCSRLSKFEAPFVFLE